MKAIYRAILAALFFALPGAALGHGFDLELNNDSWSSVTVISEEPQLDNGGNVGDGTGTGLNTLFLEDFSGTPSTSLTGGTYYSVVHGFADLAAGSYGVPPANYFTATFNIISPLYFSDGSAGSTASGAVLASSGTYIQMYDADYASFSGALYPGASPGYVTVSGSTPFAAGFQTSMDDPHELVKELYLASGSTQSYGEYGFAFDVTLTFGNGTTIVTPPLVDIFAVTDPNLGDFGQNAPDTAAAGVPQQDAATLSIFYAATSAGNAVLGNTSSWDGAANSTWSDSSNWESGVVPGSTTGTTSNDTVVFYTNATSFVPTIDAGRNVQTILFEMGQSEFGTPGVGSLTLGSTTGNALLLTNGGSIQVTSTVANPQSINAPLVLEGTNALYTFNSDSLNSSATLSFGGSITGGAAGDTTLTLGGDNTGNNTISGAIANGSATSLALLVSGPANWILSGPNSYTGGTTVNQGTLNVTATGTLGANTSPLTITTVANLETAAVNINGNQQIGNLSGTVNGLFNTATLNIAAGSSLRVNQTANTTFGPTLTIAAGSPGNSGTFTLVGTSSASLEIDAPASLGDYAAINVNGGTLRFNNTTGPATVGTGVTATVAAPATLQLTGSYSALSGGGTANIVNNGSTASGGGLFVTASSQTIGIVSGNTSTSSGATTYGGDTTVGDGTSPASLTASQILQNSLTIDANSTVMILPASSGSSDTANDAASASVTAANSQEISPPISEPEALAAIRSAIASGAITQSDGDQLENRIADIEQLAAHFPDLNLAPLEDHMLSEIPPQDILAAEANPSSTPLFGVSGSEGNSVLSTVSIGTAAVPEPSAIFLAVLVSLAVGLFAACRGTATSPPPRPRGSA